MPILKKPSVKRDYKFLEKMLEGEVCKKSSTKGKKIAMLIAINRDNIYSKRKLAETVGVSATTIQHWKLQIEKEKGTINEFLRERKNGKPKKITEQIEAEVRLFLERYFKTHRKRKTHGFIKSVYDILKTNRTINNIDYTTFYRFWKEKQLNDHCKQLAENQQRFHTNRRVDPPKISWPEFKDVNWDDGKIDEFSGKLLERMQMLWKKKVKHLPSPASIKEFDPKEVFAAVKVVLREWSGVELRIEDFYGRRRF